jgi:hypothetical protein
VAGERVYQSAGDARGDHGVTGGDRADAIEQLGRRDVLEQEPAGASCESWIDAGSGASPPRLGAGLVAAATGLCLRP